MSQNLEELSQEYIITPSCLIKCQRFSFEDQGRDLRTLKAPQRQRYVYRDIKCYYIKKEIWGNGNL